MTEPTGVIIADHDTDELRADLRVIRFFDRGRLRELRLRMARGVIKDVGQGHYPDMEDIDV